MPTIKKRFDGAQFIEALKADPIAWEALLRLGVRSQPSRLRNFVALVAQYCSSAEIFPERKAELDELKQDLEALMIRLRQAADESERVAAKRFKILARYPTSHNVPTLLNLSDVLMQKATAIETERMAVAREFSLRVITPTTYLAMIYYFCCELAGDDRVTFRDLAEVLTKGAAEVVSEDGIRKSIQRFSEQEIAQGRPLRSQIRTYLRTCPTGIPNFVDWMKAKESQQDPGHEHPQK